ncbi:hypothetical protein EGH22_01775 [Halomicroarcula sp. F28]|uniref:hypothetical protein n=1 Tax=Haloarcula salinisoli TaxID=2487746 RepID=UPI001C73CE43|nr:hypothetical protein [Halomicroarcula salinisoli]MBX0285043.1 hypothetical protein [Halomicroarcula salinisoli]
MLKFFEWRSMRNFATGTEVNESSGNVSVTGRCGPLTRSGGTCSFCTSDTDAVDCSESYCSTIFTLLVIVPISIAGTEALIIATVSKTATPTRII